MPLNASDREAVIELGYAVRTLTVQMLKIYLQVETLRTILIDQQTIREDLLPAVLTAIDDTSAREPSPDRPSVAMLDNVLRQLVRPRTNAH
jgi:hypothetical protein